MASITGGVGYGAPARQRAPGVPQPTRITTQPRSTRYPGARNPGATRMPVPIKVTTQPRSSHPDPNPPPTAPQATTPGAAPPSTPGTTPGAPAYPSPYDSTYWAQLAAYDNHAMQQIAANRQNISNAGTSLQSAFTQLAKNQALQTTNAQDAENARGGFAQGALGHTVGQIAANTLTVHNADQAKYSQNVAAWNSAISAIEQGVPVEQAALAAASAARQAALGLTAPAAPAAATAPAPGSPGGAPRGTGAGDRGSFSTYRGGPSKAAPSKAPVHHVNVPKGTRQGFRGGPAKWR